MGATLAWAKVVDTGRWRLEGGDVDVKSGMDSVVELEGPAPAQARPFVVHRAWSGFDSAFTERWVIRDPYGRTLREGIEREVVAGFGGPGAGGLSDEIEGLLFEFADAGYQLVLQVDGTEVARADFEVREPEDSDLYGAAG